jgi:hypothetical protein
VAQGIQRGTLLAGIGAWSGGEGRVRAIGAGAAPRDWGLAVRDWGGDRVCHCWNLGTGITRGSAGGGARLA